MYKHTLLRCLRLFIVIGSIILIYFGLKYMIIFFFPFLIAMLCSFMLHPVVTYVEHKLRFPRIVATLFIVCFLFILIGFITFVLITEIIQGTTYLAIQIPAHFETFTAQFELFLTGKIVPLYDQLTSFIKSLRTSQQSTINENIEQLTTQLTNSGTIFLKNFLLKIPTILSMIPYSITMMIFTIIATILITNDWFTLKKFAGKIVPKKLRHTSQDILKYFEKSLFGYVRAQLILIYMTACITFIGLLLLKINHSLTITMMIALVDLLPLIGTGVIFIPWIGYLFFTSHYPLTIGIATIYIVVIITRQILEPKIVSANIGISPLVTLLAVFTSIQLWGVTGALITPLILVAINTCYRAGIFNRIWHYVKG